MGDEKAEDASRMLSEAGKYSKRKPAERLFERAGRDLPAGRKGTVAGEIMQEAMEKLIEAAIRAPSGENCQPWRFVVQGNTIRLYNIPEKDTSLYNFGQRGSLVSHGALIENLDIAARGAGLRMAVDLLPDAGDRTLVAVLTFTEAAIVSDPLFPFIMRRATNRKPYRARPLPEREKEALLAAAGEAGGELYVIDDPQKMKVVADAVSVNEELVFSNKNLHQFFFSHLNWTEEEDKKKGSGFFIDTLELSPPQRLALKLFRHWKALRIANYVFGISKKIARDNAKVYRASAAMALIHIPGNGDADFVNAGRVFERVWLAAAMRGLSLQPTTGVLFFMQRLQAGDTRGFSTKEVTRISEAYNVILKAFGVSGGTVPIVFRVGYASPPTARASRQEPVIDGLQKPAHPVRGVRAASGRAREIDETLQMLESLKKDPAHQGNLYALEENIAFFHAARSARSYILWLLTRGRKANTERLREVTDFPVEAWDREMHSRLIEVQRNDQIGLAKPLVDHILRFIQQENRPLILADLGAGGMEIERQVILDLLSRGYGTEIIFVGIDTSPMTHTIAKGNLKTLGAEVALYTVDHLDKNSLAAIIRERKSNIVVVLCRNDIFQLTHDFPPRYFDLMYHSLFRHHLTLEEQKKLEEVSGTVAKNACEYDGYRTWPVLIPQSLTAWQHPLFLSSTIFSFLRYPLRHQVIAQEGSVSFFKKTGHYLRILPSHG